MKVHPPNTQTPYSVRPALCLDLDGTVRYSKTGKFINNPVDVALYPDVESKLWEYRDNKYLIFGITNQGGIAYGMKTQKGHSEEIKRMFSLFERNPFHIVNSCFHHSQGHVEPYNYRSLLRKPDIGMLAMCEVQAAEAGFVVDWNSSLFVGDRPEDQQCAKNANIYFEWAWEFFDRPEPMVLV